MYIAFIDRISIKLEGMILILKYESNPYLFRVIIK